MTPEELGAKERQIRTFSYEGPDASMPCGRAIRMDAAEWSWMWAELRGLTAEVERLRGRRNHWAEGDLVVEQRTLFRQVGWLGQSGMFYGVENQAVATEREPAGFAPVYQQIDVDDGDGWHG